MEKVKKEVVIKRFQLDHVFAHDKILYNTNNHEYSEEQPKPPDYHETSERTQTKYWIDKFHKDNCDDMYSHERTDLLYSENLKHKPRSRL